MQVFIQWTRAHPRGWEEFDSSEWDSLPKRPAPVGEDVVDDNPGWPMAIRCGKIMLSGFDHYAVEDDGRATRITVWSDDLSDTNPGFTEADACELAAEA